MGHSEKAEKTISKISYRPHTYICINIITLAVES